MTFNQTHPHPEWKVMFDKFKDLNYNTQITYDDLNKCLAFGKVQDNKRYVFEKFKKELLHQENKLLENIPNVGYRIIYPNEHIRLTNRELKRAEKRARQGVDIILHTDVDKLTPREMSQLTIVATRMQNLASTLISENKSIKQIDISFKLPQKSYSPHKDN